MLCRQTKPWHGTEMGQCVGDGDTESLSGEMMSEQVQRPEVGVGLGVGGGAQEAEWLPLRCLHSFIPLFVYQPLWSTMCQALG